MDTVFQRETSSEVVISQHEVTGSEEGTSDGMLPSVCKGRI